MVDTIFRYELSVVDSQVLLLPGVCELLSVAPGRNGYYIDLWVRVNDDHPPVPREFRIVGTGHIIPGDVELEYVGTAVMEGGLVWHVFAAEPVRAAVEAAAVKSTYLHPAPTSG